MLSRIWMTLGTGVLLCAAATSAMAQERPLHPDNPLVSSIRIEADAGVPAAEPARTPPLSAAAKAALREQLRQRVTRLSGPNGSRVYRYNGLVTDSLIAHRDAAGTLHVICTDDTHAVAARSAEASDVR